MSLLGDLEKDIEITKEALLNMGFMECREYSNHVYYQYNKLHFTTVGTTIEYWMDDYEGESHCSGVSLRGRVFVSGMLRKENSKKREFSSYHHKISDMLEMQSIIDNSVKGIIPSYVSVVETGW